MKNIHNYIFIFLLLLIATACSDVKIETADSYELVELPDNSYVFLNKNSYLAYDENFNNRYVKLEGEAYFDVTEGETAFIVNTSMGEIKVLGTEFSVRSTNNDLKVQVKKGTVEVKAKDQVEKLDRGQQASINKNSNKFKKAKADVDYEVWLSDMHIELNKLGKEFRRGARILGKESKKVTKDLKKETGKLKKSL